MKCWIEKSDFAVAHAAIQPPVSPDDDDEFRYMHYEGYLRAEASGGMLRLHCSYGQAEAPARVERPGVFFVETREFVGATKIALESDFVDCIEIESSGRRIRANHLGFLLGRDNFAIFDDPATAPETWERPPAPPDDDFENDADTVQDEGSLQNADA